MAAKTSSAEFVELLLNNQADPNLLSEKSDKQNALAFALKTGNEKIISLLSEVTTEGMESCIRVLAESNMSVGKEIKVILEKLIQEEMKDLLLKEATIFGNGHMANFLLNDSNLDWTKSVLEEIISLLSEVTTEGMESFTRFLAESNMSVGKGIKVILEKLIQEEKKDLLLKEASIFGNGHMANFLLNDSNLDWTKSVLEEGLRNSILSDNVDCCKIVKDYSDKIGVDTISQ